MKEKLVLLPVVIIFFLLGGCTLAPEYTRPASPVPDQLPKSSAYQETKTGTSAPTAAELSWREFITDKKMQKIVETALKNNRNLRIAALNVERARAYYGIQRAELLP